MPCFPISWNDIPHTDLSLPQGKWKFPEGEDFGAMMFQIVRTARDLGMPVHEFLQLPDDEKAIQIAYSSIVLKIEQVNEQDRADSVTKARAKRGK